ncbi:MAG: hypothetical protein IID37_08160 [Planctomycetes bacterium]|nr:hypothetical protein [Planctomycetota bacterium]
MGFEFFTESGRGFRPRASIRKQGQIGLNQGAVRRFELQRWGYVVLGFDREKQLLALKLTADRDEPGAQRVVMKDGSATISARSFLEYFDISYREETRQYDVEFDAAQALLVVSIGGEVENGEREEQLIDSL